MGSNLYIVGEIYIEAHVRLKAKVWLPKKRSKFKCKMQYGNQKAKVSKNFLEKEKKRSFTQQNKLRLCRKLKKKVLKLDLLN